MKHGNRKYEPKEASLRAKATNYKYLAKKRGIEWGLSTEQTVRLLSGDCHYCNCHPSNSFSVILRSRPRRSDGKFKTLPQEEYNVFYNGIDRVDNTRGYLPDNCVTCCTTCNTAKLEMSLQEFTKWFNKLKENYKNWAQED